MIDASVHLRRYPLAGLVEADAGGRPALDTWDSVTAAAERLGLARDLALFARPSATRDNGVSAGQVTWYGTRSGVLIPLRKLPGDQRARLAEELSAGLERLRPLLDDPDAGMTFSTWLNVASPDDDIFLLTERPVVTNWGLLPAAAAVSAEVQEAHFRRGIGRFAPPGMPAPAFAASSGGDGGVRPRTAPPDESPSEPAAATAAPLPSVPGPEVPHLQRIEIVTERAWLPVAIATGIAAAILLLLLIPGILIYPSGLRSRQPIDAGLLAQTRETLEGRVRDLEGALRGTQCGPAPPGAAPQPGGAPSPRTERGTPGGGSAPRQSILPPPPAAVAGPATGGSRPPSLVAHLDQVTALIYSPNRNGEGGSAGTGFFISNRHVVTNRHVIEEGDPAQVFVFSKGMSRRLTGKVIGATPSSDVGGEDFAVVETDPVDGRTGLTLTQRIARGDTVVAAGYPAVVMRNDRAFQNWQESDAGRLPDPAITQGMVTALQTGEHGSPVMVHGALIAEGNSGGPLSDLCGRLVGVNTYGQVDASSALRLNYALRTESLKRFLDEKRIAYANSDDECQPAPLLSAATPAAEARPAPVTAPPSPLPTGPPAAGGRSPEPAR